PIFTHILYTTLFRSNENTENGNVRISNEVISIIAGVAANEIDGVVSMSGGITGGITEMLGMKNLSKGVKVDINEKEANIDIFIRSEEHTSELQSRFD